MTRWAVETTGLGKTYRKKKSVKELLRRPFVPGQPVRALDGVNLRVERGEIFGLLGPNGAGKTTLIKILSSLVLPTDGTALIEGADPRHGPLARRKLGLVTSDDRSFYWRLTGAENLRFFARLHQIPRSIMNGRIGGLLERVDLSDAADRAYSAYSSGMRQRLGFARALLHDPPVLLLDEPTRSLDPVAARSIRRFACDELRGRDGKTLLIATHNLHEAAAICDRIAIIQKGRVIETGPPSVIRRLGLPADVYRIECRGTPPAGHPAIRLLPPEKGGEPGVGRLEATLREGEPLGVVLAAIAAAGAEILACERVEPDLEEAFETILRRATGEDR